MQTCSAAVAMKALQNEIKELRGQNEMLKKQVLRESSENSLKSDLCAEKMNAVEWLSASKEAQMKADILFLCEKVQELEFENRRMVKVNQELERKLEEHEKNFGKYLVTHQLADKGIFESSQKDAEIDFLKRKIEWLERSSQKFSQDKKYSTQGVFKDHINFYNTSGSFNTWNRGQ